MKTKIYEGEFTVFENISTEKEYYVVIVLVKDHFEYIIITDVGIHTTPDVFCAEKWSSKQKCKEYIEYLRRFEPKFRKTQIYIGQITKVGIEQQEEC